MPTVHVDITAVWDKKVAAMAEMKCPAVPQNYYAQRGELRATTRGGPPATSRAAGRVVPARHPQVVDQL